MTKSVTAKTWMDEQLEKVEESRCSLVVTKNGVPFADQAQGIREFLEAATKRPRANPFDVIRKRLSANCVQDLPAIAALDELEEVWKRQ
jgi:hypothetical protein